MHNTVFIIHTSSVSVNDLNALFREFAPELIVRNIIDDSLLPEVIANRGVTEAVRKRYRLYALAAVEAGARLIFNQCSSVREAAEWAVRDLPVLFCSIDEAMAERACEIGERVGVVATLETTLGPTCRLIESKALQEKKNIQVFAHLCEGAFEKLIAGDRKTHNEMVIAAIHDLSKKVDVVVCAQGSMVALLPDLGTINVPVLTSPRLGVQKAIGMLSG